MSRSDSLMSTVNPNAGSARRRRTVLVAAVTLGVLLFGAGLAAACIPWTGKFELQNTDANGDVDNQGDENGVAVYGADHSDVDKSGTSGADRGNGQGMVWCDADDSFGQQYNWAEVHPSNIQPDGTSGGADGIPDIKLIVDDNNDDTTDNGTDLPGSDTTGGCGSDLYLPEDEYSITFDEDSFDNEDGSGDSDSDGSCDDDADGDECTYADNHSSSDNGGSAEVGTVGSSSHCMNTDDNASDDAEKGDSGHEIYWDLTEDENESNDKNDGGDPVDDDRFPAAWSGSSQGHDVIDEGPHSTTVDFDAFSYDADDSGDDSDGDSHTDAAAICITSHEHYEHDNDGSDSEDDDEVEGGDKDGITVEYGNAIPVNVLNSV